MLVGRSRELDLLRAERHRSALGELRVALVLGDAGLGKTGLVTELLSTGDQSTIGLIIHCFPFQRLSMFGCWRVPSRQDGEPGVDELSHKCALDAISNFLCCANVADDVTFTSEALRHDLIERVFGLLANASIDRPVVVVLDDAHDGDDAVWEMLLRLALNFPTNRLFVIAVARSGSLARHRRASTVLHLLDQETILYRSRLSPLTREDVQELAVRSLRQDTVSPAIVDWLMARSQGNPRFAVGLVEALIDHNMNFQAPELSTVPEKLAAWVHAEVMRLDPSTLPLLELLAVIGDSVDPDVLAQIADTPVEDVALTLEQLVSDGMVVEQEYGRSLSYRISHPLVRDVVCTRIGGARRRVMHRRVARTLGRSGRAIIMSPHVLRPVHVGDCDTVEVLLEQARQAQQRELSSQVWTVVQKLLDLLPSGDRRWREVTDLLSRRSGSDLVTGAKCYPVIETTAVQRTQHLFAGIGDLRSRASIHLWLAGLYVYGAGDSDAGERECKRAASLYRQAGCAQESRIATIELARIRGRLGDLRGEESEARRLVSEAESAGDQHGIVEALAAWGHSLGWQGRFAEAEDVVTRCVGLAHAVPHGSRASRSLALLAALDACRGHLTQGHARWADAAACRPLHDRAVADCGAFLAFLAGELGTVRVPAGQAAVRNSAAQPQQSVWLQTLSVLVAVERGCLTEARQYLDGMAYANHCGQPTLPAVFSWWAEGVVAWAEGRLADGTLVLQRVVDSYLTMSASALVSFVLVDLAEVAVTAGDPGTAARAVKQIDDVACQTGAPGHEALGLLTTAWGMLGGGRHDEAAQAAMRAIDGFSSSGYMLLAARAQFTYAVAIQHHDRNAAVDSLRQTVAAFDRCGAALRRDQAHALLTQLETGLTSVELDQGGTAEATKRSASLTDRERQVAELAARGYTARQIASRLYIGIRTVETHLQRIYAKLGITRKQQLVHRARQFGFTSVP